MRKITEKFIEIFQHQRTTKRLIMEFRIIIWLLVGLAFFMALVTVVTEADPSGSNPCRNQIYNGLEPWNVADSNCKTCCQANSFDVGAVVTARYCQCFDEDAYLNYQLKV